MIYEFALEPALVATWGKQLEYRYFYEKFGLGQPRIISQYPEKVKWRQQVLEAASEIRDLEKSRIEELLKRLSEEMISREGYSYDGNIAWLENAEKEDQRCQFYAILALSNPTNHRRVLIGLELSQNDDPRWQLKDEEVVARNAGDMANIVAPMLTNCSEALFIDPHFRPDQSRYQRPLELFLKGLMKDRRVHPMPTRIEVQTSDDYSAEHFKSKCGKCLPRIIPQGIRILIKRWKQNEAGQRLHNRYILTDIGGVRFATGLDENRDDPNGDTDEVSLLRRETYTNRWAQYAGPSPAFELAEEPITIVGKA